MKLAVVLWHDRHVDTTVHLFTDPEMAVAWARTKAKENNRYGDLTEITLTQSMRKSGWIYAIDYSCEGDGLRVEMIEVDEDKP